MLVCSASFVCFFNHFSPSKQLKCKGLLGIKETEKTLLIRKSNERTEFKKTKDDD